MFKIFILFFLFWSSVNAQTPSPWPYNPWYFDLDGHAYKVCSNDEDIVNVYRYDWQRDSFDYFQNLSDYAQKVDYFMEGPGRHFVSVTDESGHMVIYIWQYADVPGEGEFVYWGLSKDL